MRPLHVASGARSDPLLAGDSPVRERLLQTLSRLAGTPRTTVLVRGEPGAGKRAAARTLHALSARAAGPLRVVGIPETRARGFAEAFFGRGGGLAALAGGTLVVAEIGRAALDVLDALARELGAGLSSDVRLIATTSVDLEAEVERGRLRADLLYRINVLVADVPPLREREADVVPIAEAFWARAAFEAGTAAPRLTADAALALRAHAWPGNLRELSGVCIAALARARGGAIGPRDLALPGATAPGPEPEDRTLRGAEERLIRRVLAETGGNKSRAARLLGVNRQTLYNKLALLGLVPAGGAW